MWVEGRHVRRFLISRRWLAPLWAPLQVPFAPVKGADYAEPEEDYSAPNSRGGEADERP